MDSKGRNDFSNGTHINSGRKPRICLLTTRGFISSTYRCGFYEGQDVLLDIDDVDLIILQPKGDYAFRKLLHEKIVWHDYTHMMMKVNLTLQPVKLAKDYDLFIAYLPSFEDVIHIPAIQGLSKRCAKSVCWVNELWVKDVHWPNFARLWLPTLNPFDHIAFGLEATANTVGKLLNRPCHFVPCGVDTLRFSPYPDPVARVVDIYNMGRTWQKLHESLLTIASRQQLFYVYDTFGSGDSEVRDYRQHRDMLASFAKRSKYFVVAPAKMNAADQTDGQIEIGARYFEAAAAGAVLLGQAPACAPFHTLFNWPDSVIGISPDGSDAADMLSSLAGQPGRLQEISRRNATEALLRHDWLYRWKHILAIAGLTPTPRLEQRENKLKAMAQAANSAENNGLIGVGRR